MTTASPALLTQELESAMAWLRALSDSHDDSIHPVHKSCAAALLQHIAALEQRVEALPIAWHDFGSREGWAIRPAHEVADAFWKYWRENGETHRHGYYESTWGAINAALAAALPKEPR